MGIQVFVGAFTARVSSALSLLDGLLSANAVVWLLYGFTSLVWGAGAGIGWKGFG